MTHSDSPVLDPRSAAPAETAAATESAAPAVAGTSPERFVLGRGDLRTTITSLGTGDTRIGDVALTAWRADPVEDGEGSFVYLEEPARERLWSIGAEPIAPRDGDAWCEGADGLVRLGREEYGLMATLDVWV